MISPEQKDKIISILGNHYSGEIILHLNEKEIFNSDGKPFSNSGIRNIVNGLRTNLVVETEIANLLQYRTKLQTKLEKKFQNI